MAAVPHAYDAPRTKFAAASLPYRRHLLLERLGTGGRTSIVCMWSPFRERGNDALKKAYKSVNFPHVTDSPGKENSDQMSEQSGQRELAAAGTPPERH
ncbi:hypothetical protein [Streptomyces coffeae]|uniref:Uncharacterized protein n=1 Tax=Streptomyces coffeae TaxID=621382 RepID=A0ABS1NEX5_9ACTN|nr:hypothetical protein [Streptomyces coffeae]MBL1098644.1 hypothetical protein [Streptomyces coffeae]